MLCMTDGSQNIHTDALTDVENFCAESEKMSYNTSLLPELTWSS